MLEGIEVEDRGGQRGKNWDNCNSIINKNIFKKEIDNSIEELPFIKISSSKNKTKQKPNKK